MSEINFTEQYKARKAHRCALCGKTILPGREYIRQRWFDDGWRESKRHIHCDAVMNAALNRLGWPNEYYDDELDEELSDVCYGLCSDGKCDKDRCNCGRAEIYTCEAVWRELIDNPVILAAARRSAEENRED